MTMREMKKAIVAALKNTYGFTCRQKDIIPLESSGYCDKVMDTYTWMAFAVGNKGYGYTAHDTVVERLEQYDL